MDAHKRAHLKFQHSIMWRDLMSNCGILVRIKETEDCCNTKTWCEEPTLDLMGKVRKQKRIPQLDLKS
jgi:hypothetical protein